MQLFTTEMGQHSTVLLWHGQKRLPEQMVCSMAPRFTDNHHVRFHSKLTLPVVVVILILIVSLYRVVQR